MHQPLTKTRLHLKIPVIIMYIEKIAKFIYDRHFGGQVIYVLDN